MAPALIASWSLIFVLMTGDITASAMLISTVVVLAALGIRNRFRLD
jgi:ABC-type Fe3+ transport system permease subunit